MVVHQIAFMLDVKDLHLGFCDLLCAYNIITLENNLEVLAALQGSTMVFKCKNCFQIQLNLHEMNCLG